MVLVGLSIAAAVAFLIAMQQDVTRRKIPNILCAAVLLIGVLKWLVVWRLDAALSALAAGFAVFLVTAFMNWRGWMGGGDVKLLTASSVFLGAASVIPFLTWTALFGGLLSVIVLASSLLSRYRRKRGLEVGDVDGVATAATAARVTVPYGVAISLAALLIMYRQSH